MKFLVLISSRSKHKTVKSVYPPPFSGTEDLYIFINNIPKRAIPHFVKPSRQNLMMLREGFDTLESVCC